MMRSVSLKELLALALEIERRSISYYEKASGLLLDGESRRLATALAREERVHLEKLTRLQEAAAHSNTLDLGVDLQPVSGIGEIDIQAITGDTQPREILELARRGERETQAFYQAILDGAELPVEWHEMLTYLRDQEKSHAFRLGAILERSSN